MEILLWERIFDTLIFASDERAPDADGEASNGREDPRHRNPEVLHHRGHKRQVHSRKSRRGLHRQVGIIVTTRNLETSIRIRIFLSTF